MTISLQHCYYRIEKYLEVRSCVRLSLCRYGRSQMSAGRKSHYSQIVRINMPLLSVTAHRAYSLLSVADGHFRIAVRHTVLQYDGSDAHIIEERLPVIALMLHGKVLITATRTNHHSPSRSLLAVRKIYVYACRVGMCVLIRSLSLPDVHREVALCESRNHCKDHQQ